MPDRFEKITDVLEFLKQQSGRKKIDPAEQLILDTIVEEYVLVTDSLLRIADALEQIAHTHEVQMSNIEINTRHK
jgi:hypothetical protein